MVRKYLGKGFRGNDEDVATSVSPTSNAGFILAGWSRSFGQGDADFWVLKLDAKGNSQWQKAYGGKEEDWPIEILQTSDGGCVVSGRTQSFGSAPRDTNAWVIKLDGQGKVQWQKSYGNRFLNVGYGIAKASDGGFALTGVSEPQHGAFSDAWTLKIDRSGAIQWSKTYGGENWDRTDRIKSTPDGGFVAVGYSASFLRMKSGHFLVLKTGSAGSIAGCSHFVLRPLKVKAYDTNAATVGTHVKPEKIELVVLKTNARAVPSRAQVEVQ